MPDSEKVKGAASYFPSIEKKYDFPVNHWFDVMLAKRKMCSKALAEHLGITEQNVSLLESGKVKGIRFDTLEKICEVLDCQGVSV